MFSAVYFVHCSQLFIHIFLRYFLSSTSNDDFNFAYLFSVGISQSAGIGEPSVYHALVVIFLEFFAWGLLTMPLITVSEIQ